MALIDVLRKQQQQKAIPPVPRTSVEALRGLMSYGQTGKVQQRTGPAAVSLAAQTAQAGVQQAGEQIQSAAQRQAAAQQAQLEEQQAAQAQQAQAIDFQAAQAQRGIAAGEQQAIARRQTEEEMAATRRSAQEEQAINQITNTYANALADLASQRKTTENELFSGLRQEMASLSADKQLARMQQLGHMMAMSDKEYVRSIQQVGALQGLQDDIAFKIEADKLAFGKDLEILQQRFDAEALLQADARKFKEEMEDMSLDHALEMADLAMREQNAKSFMEGLGGVATAAINYKQYTPASQSSIPYGSTGNEQQANQSLIPSLRYGSSSDPFSSTPTPATPGYTPKNWWED